MLFGRFRLVFCMWVTLTFLCGTIQAQEGVNKGESAKVIAHHTEVARKLANFVRGKALFEKGLYKESLVFLSKAFTEEPDNLNVNYYLGRAFYEVKDYENAFMSFDRMMFVSDDLPRAKFELARVCMKLKLYGEAELYFNEVRKGEAPLALKENIKTLLVNLHSSEQHHFWEGQLVLGGAFDSNISVGPSDDVLVGNIPFTIPKENGFFAGQTLSLNHEYRYFLSAPHVWGTSFVSYNSWYDGEVEQMDGESDNLNLNFVGLGTGPRFFLDDWQLDIRANGSYMFKASQDYMKAAGLSLGATTKLSDTVWYNFTVKSERRKFHTQPQFDGWNTALYDTITYVDGKNMVRGLLGYERNDVDGRWEEYHRLIASLNYTRQLGSSTSVSVGYKYENSKYGMKHPVFGKRRNDGAHEASITLTQMITESLSVKLSHRYTRAYSTLDAYSYDRHVSMLSLIYNF